MKWVPQTDGASPVIMLRSLPKGTTEADLHKWAEGFTYQPKDAAGSPMGLRETAKVVKALVLVDRLIGFVQFVDIEMSREVMNQFVTNPPSIVLRKHGEAHPLNLVYSDKPEIRSQNRGRVSPVPQPVYTNARLLLVVLKDLKGSISIDELFWVFTQVSRVEKISSFIKDSKNQIVVQFETPEGAAKALDYFNGKHFPQFPADGSLPDNGAPTEALCFLAIVPSKLQQLTFRNQDARNREYTEVNRRLQSLADSPGAVSQTKASAVAEWVGLCEACNMNVRKGHPLYDYIWSEMRWGEGWLVPRQPAEFKGRMPPPSPAGGIAPSQGQVGECMHVAGLPQDDTITAAHLWRLCGMYGEVKAVKMLYKFRGCAVVQFASPEGCQAAIKYLHSLEFQGRTWDVKQSKQPNATHWNGASDDLQKRMVSAGDGLRPPPRCEQSLGYPSNVVMVYDLPEGVDEAGLRAAMQSAREYTVIKQPTSIEVDPFARTAKVSFQSINHGVLAAVYLNGAAMPAGVGGAAAPWTFKMYWGELTSPRGRRGKNRGPGSLSPRSQRRERGSGAPSPASTSPRSPPPGRASPAKAFEPPQAAPPQQPLQPPPAAAAAAAAPTNPTADAALAQAAAATAQATALAHQNAMLVTQMNQMKTQIALQQQLTQAGLGGSPLGSPVGFQDASQLQAVAGMNNLLQQQLIQQQLMNIIRNSPLTTQPPAPAQGGFADRIDSESPALNPSEPPVAMRGMRKTSNVNVGGSAKAGGGAWRPAGSGRASLFDAGRDAFGVNNQLQQAPAAQEEASPVVPPSSSSDMLDSSARMPTMASSVDDDLVRVPTSPTGRADSQSSPATPLSNTRRKLKPKNVPGLKGPEPTEESAFRTSPGVKAVTPTMSPTCSPMLYAYLHERANAPQTTMAFTQPESVLFGHTPAAATDPGDDFAARLGEDA